MTKSVVEEVMALRVIREIGDDILLKKSKEVKEITPRVIELIEDMFDTMHEAGGIGIAAPQVGVLKRIAIIDSFSNTEPEDDATVGDGSSVASDTSSDKGAVGADDDETVHHGENPELNTEPLILINPVIISKDGSHIDHEGCLSVPGKKGSVTRPMKITVRAFDENMEEFELECEGLLARAICHEIDHLDGILYVDLVEGELQDITDDADDIES